MSSRATLMRMEAEHHPVRHTSGVAHALYVALEVRLVDARVSLESLASDKARRISWFALIRLSIPAATP